jgi:hypothetical protein
VRRRPYGYEGLIMMRKALLVALPLTGVAVAAGLGLAMASQNGDPGAGASTPSGTVSTAPSAPATDAGTSRASSSAPSAATSSATTSAAPSSAGQGSPVQVVLGYAGWEPGGNVEVGGFVASVVEVGGTCTVTLTRDGRQVEATRPAEPDATTTNCGLLVVPDDQLTPGDWQATLSYRSTTSYGTSQPTLVTVPAR